MIEIIDLPCDVTNHILHFRNLLNSAWPSIENLMKDHDWDNDGDLIDDWFQVNWELFIERELLRGNGYVTPLSTVVEAQRITSVGNLPTTAVIAYGNEDLIDERTEKPIISSQSLRLGRLVSKKGHGFCWSPPFDIAVLVDDSKKDIFYVPFSKLQLKLERCKIRFNVKYYSG